jgi:hypothetical protein
MLGWPAIPDGALCGRISPSNLTDGRRFNTKRSLSQPNIAFGSYVVSYISEHSRGCWVNLHR